MKKTVFFIGVLVLVATLSACSILQAIALKDCNYSYSRISDIRLMELSGSDMLTVSGVSTIGKALLGKTETVPLSMIVHVKVENPNKTTAALEQLLYKVELDSVEIGGGCSTEAFLLPGGETKELPLHMRVDLKTALVGERRTVLAKAVKNLVGINAEPTLVTVRLRPTVRFGSSSITSPKYIPISFEYGGKKK